MEKLVPAHTCLTTTMQRGPRAIEGQIMAAGHSELPGVKKISLPEELELRRMAHTKQGRAPEKALPEKVSTMMAKGQIVKHRLSRRSLTIVKTRVGRNSKGEIHEVIRRDGKKFWCSEKDMEV